MVELEAHAPVQVCPEHFEVRRATDYPLRAKTVGVVSPQRERVGMPVPVAFSYRQDGHTRADGLEVVEIDAAARFPDESVRAVAPAHENGRGHVCRVAIARKD